MFILLLLKIIIANFVAFQYFTIMKAMLKLISILIVVFAISCQEREMDVPVDVPTPGPDEPIDVPIPEPVVPGSYTIMFYGSGGGLDNFMISMFQMLQCAEPSIPERINVVGQIKWDVHYRHNGITERTGNVSRVVFDHKTNKAVFSEFAGPEFRVDESENLVEFIRWAREIAPAEEYIIFFAGHGNSYHPSFDGTRSIIYDDMYTNYLGIDAICEAFESTDIRFSLIAMYCCFMNNMEYITELVPYTDYYYATSHVKVGISQELLFLVQGLIAYEQEEDVVLKATINMVDEIYDISRTLPENMALDYAITRCSAIANLNSEIENFVHRVYYLYEKEARIGVEAMQNNYGFTTLDIDAALSNSYFLLDSYLDYAGIEASDRPWHTRCCSYDIVDIMSRVAQVTQDSALEESVQEVRHAVDEAMVYQQLYCIDELSYGVTLVNSSEWYSMGYDEARYEDLAFDKATGWSKLLKVNKANFNHASK